MDGMFNGCSSLKNINMSKFNAKNLTNISSMFKDCTSLESIDYGGIYMSESTKKNYVYDGCTSLHTLKFSCKNSQVYMPNYGRYSKDPYNSYAKWDCKHTETSIQNYVDSTCKDEGYTGDTYCAFCDSFISNGEIIETVEHFAHDELKNVKEPTCAEEGYTGDTHCKHCDVLLTK